MAKAIKMTRGYKVKLFISGVLSVFLTALAVQLLDYSMIFYDYRIFLGILAGYYVLPYMRVEVLKRML
jgi:hypothetical protein